MITFLHTINVHLRIVFYLAPFQNKKKGEKMTKNFDLQQSRQNEYFIAPTFFEKKNDDINFYTQLI